MKIARAAYALMMTSTVACTIMNGLELPPTTNRADATPPDAGTDDDQEDAPAPNGSRCDRRAPFVRFRSIAELATAKDEALPRLTRDELTMYWYGIDSNGQTFVHRARRESRDATFGAPTAILTDVPFARTVAPSPDGAQIFFAVGDGDFSLFTATVTESGFSVPRAIKRASPGESFAMPWPVGSRVYYTRSTPNNGDLWVATIDAEGNLANDTPLSALNTSAYEFDPAVSADDLTIYFNSEREIEARGRIFVAHRDDPAQPFENPVPVEEIARPTNGWVSPGYVSDDLCRLYYYLVIDDLGDLHVAERDP